MVDRLSLMLAPLFLERTALVTAYLSRLDLRLQEEVRAHKAADDGASIEHFKVYGRHCCLLYTSNGPNTSGGDENACGEGGGHRAGGGCNWQPFCTATLSRVDRHVSAQQGRKTVALCL